MSYDPYERVKTTKFRLNTELVRRVDHLLQKMQQLGHQPIIAEGYRTKAQQADKVKKGYSKTMNSDHRSGKAVDIVDKRYFWNGPASKLDFKFWTDLGRCAKQVNLKWGGDWKSFKDVAHVYIN